MKIGELVRHKWRGWLALVLAINERKMRADIMWLDDEPNKWGCKVDNCSLGLLEIINENR